MRVCDLTQGGEDPELNVKVDRGRERERDVVRLPN